MIHVNDLTCPRRRPHADRRRATVALPEGARVGVVGRNGTGKTTLFKVIAGELQPTTARSRLPKAARIGSVAQEAPAGPEPLIDVVLAADKERAALMAESETGPIRTASPTSSTRLIDIDAYAAPARAAAILLGPRLRRRGAAAALLRFLRRLAHARRARGRAVLRARPAAARRADQPPRPRRHALAAGLSAKLSAHGARHQPRPRPAQRLRSTTSCISTAASSPSGRATTTASTPARAREAARSTRRPRRQQAEERARLQAFIDPLQGQGLEGDAGAIRVKRLAKMQPVTAVIERSVVPFQIPEPEKELRPAPDRARRRLGRLWRQDDPQEARPAHRPGRPHRAARRRTATASRPSRSSSPAGSRRIGRLAKSDADAGRLLRPASDRGSESRRLAPTTTSGRRCRARAEAQVRARVAQIGFSGASAPTPRSRRCRAARRPASPSASRCSTGRICSSSTSRPTISTSTAARASPRR